LRPQHYRLAAAVELVHGASLAHDDVLDESARRRHKPTVNARWGNELAILAGDILFANAFRLSTEPGNDGAAAILARASCMTCLGETEQTFCEKCHPLSEETYLKMVELKTASVFSAACELGAMFAIGHGRPSDGSLRQHDALLVRCFTQYGRNFGIAYQLADDLVDLLGSEERTGKTLGRDLAAGKMTFPLICLLNAVKSSSRRRAILQAVCRGWSADARRTIVRAARHVGVVASTMWHVRRHVAAAKLCLAHVRPSVWLRILVDAAENIAGVANEL
jgi:octaprenyl-diphosphate synthase